MSVWIDKFTVQSELLNSMVDGGNSLLGVIDRYDAMGARLMRRWILFPLKDEKPVNERWMWWITFPRTGV